MYITCCKALLITCGYYVCDVYGVTVDRRPSGIDREFFIQIFVEPDEGKLTVTTQRLLNKMFQEQHISFLKVCFNIYIYIYIYICNS